MRARVLAASWLLWASGLLGQPAGETVTVRGTDGPVRLPVVRHHGYPVVELAGLVGALLSDANLGVQSAAGRVGGELLHLRAGSPFFRYGSRTLQLVNPPYRWQDGFWVPVELLVRWWAAEAASGSSAVADDAPDAGWAAPVREPGPWRVVIDPGHGGKDAGTQTWRGRTREKDVVLGIARRLRNKLAVMPDVRPILTRDEDRFVTVRGRPDFALAQKGDLFLSIHANSAPSRRARGFETYFLGEARTDESRNVAMRENAALQYESEDGDQAVGDLSYILASLDLSAFRDASNRLGGFVQNALRRVHPGPDRGVKPGPYWVLVGASGGMPTVLVEVGFLSNPADEEFLRGDAGQERIADSLARAIRAYLDEYGRRFQTAGGSE
ncbi:MAG: N-acetylmuramoyl-L-alanine amidase [Gemmatimonadota bacterium]